MQKLMILAAGLLQIPVIKKAKEKGYYVIAVDDDPQAPGMCLADKAIVPGGLINEDVGYRPRGTGERCDPSLLRGGNECDGTD